MNHKESETDLVSRSDHARRGATIAALALSVPVLIGFAALAVDVGVMYAAKADAQKAADAAALAAAAGLLDETRLRGPTFMVDVIDGSRAAAAEFAALNSIFGNPAMVNASSDVTMGRLTDWATMNFTPMETEQTNAVRVDIALDGGDGHGDPVALFFAPIFGVDQATVSAQATAAFEDCIDGFTVTGDENSKLLPFALHVDYWTDLMAGDIGNDSYVYDPDGGTVSAGSDGVLELNLYPGAMNDQLPPGNFGTVDIGSPDNGTKDVRRQILEGPNAADFAIIGGSLELDPVTGTFDLNGDTGLSAGFKAELEAIIGQPRIIPLFNAVAGPGNNAMYTIVDFAGIRILDVKLTGPMTKKYLIIQPAVVVDPTASGGGSCVVTAWVVVPPRLTFNN